MTPGTSSIPAAQGAVEPALGCETRRDLTQRRDLTSAAHLVGQPKPATRSRRLKSAVHGTKPRLACVRPCRKKTCRAAWPQRAFRSRRPGFPNWRIVKTFSHSDLEEQRRYSPPDVINVKRIPVSGSPVVDLISTSHVEKQNHTLRMHCRRLTRLTNAFSKKLENFKAAVALHYAYYNFVKSNIAIRCTPAMAAGVTNTLWTVRDLVTMVEA